MTSTNQSGSNPDWLPEPKMKKQPTTNSILERGLNPTTRRRVMTLERESPRIVDLAHQAGVNIEYLGVAPLFDEALTFVGEDTDWLISPAREDDTAFIPRQQAQTLTRLNSSGINFPLLYVGHEVPKGRIEEASSAPTGALVPLPAEQVADLVDPIPPPALAVDLGDRMSQRARQVFSETPKDSAIDVLATPSPAISSPLASRTARWGNETLAAIASSSARSFLDNRNGGAGGRAMPQCTLTARLFTCHHNR